MKQKKRNPKVFWWVIAGSLVVLTAVLALIFAAPKEENTILKELRAKNGYIRSVGADEYAFFEKLVSRDSTSELTEAELKAQTIEKINQVNVLFMLASRMDLCKPYSFESFQLDMENENSQRKLKKEKGEVLILYGRQYPFITELPDIDEYEMYKGHPACDKKKSDISSGKVIDLKHILYLLQNGELRLFEEENAEDDTGIVKKLESEVRSKLKAFFDD